MRDVARVVRDAVVPRTVVARVVRDAVVVRGAVVMTGDAVVMMEGAARVLNAVEAIVVNDKIEKPKLPLDPVVVRLPLDLVQ